MSTKAYIVVDRCEDLEQILTLRTDPEYPPGGILDWTNNDSHPRHVFLTRADARAAIVRTDHYRLAFAPLKWPDKASCKIIAIKFPQKEEAP